MPSWSEPSSIRYKRSKGPPPCASDLSKDCPRSKPRPKETIHTPQNTFVRRRRTADVDGLLACGTRTTTGTDGSPAVEARADIPYLPCGVIVIVRGRIQTKNLTGRRVRDRKDTSLAHAHTDVNNGLQYIISKLGGVSSLNPDLSLCNSSSCYQP
ncbi:hypothetical protein WAI453_012634 [Rhynchosporium graminicola]